ncbi:SgrR family transcriptional regulator [Rahnella bruchi]|uniref:SgrR family transcriptional regulator n=1 Tax=Rahnella bruchi TaxID=1510573 RepID=UPI000EA10A04|nr:SgrR family transcriptional regulator [Rahnella bruchi]
MRLQNRLNQFQRLYLKTGSFPVQLTVAELAEIFCCSERHTRTLLTHFQDAGWIDWKSQAGRGKRASLCCLRTPEDLRGTYLQELLINGEHSAALQLSQLDPTHLNALLAPHLGGQWQEDAPTLRIPYYRPLQLLDPLTLTGRAEQHLAHTIHAGLTRYVPGNSAPQPDLAHHWQVSNSGKTWQFFLRSQLFWHNGEPLKTAQLMTRFQQLKNSARGKHNLASVTTLSQPHALCLQFDLDKPDYWLAHRFADLNCLLSHPEDPHIGAGPFRLTTFSPELVRLEQHTLYTLQHPYLAAIEFWITPQLFAQKNNVSCQHPVRIILGEQEELSRVKPVRRSTSLGFCYIAANLKRGVLNEAQARKIVRLIQSSGMLNNLPIDHDLVRSSKEMLPGWPIPLHDDADVLLPEKLSLLFHPPVEFELVAQALKEKLAEEGCALEVRYHAGRLWEDDILLSSADLLLGDRLIGESPEASLENWLQQDPLWPGILRDVDYQRQQQRLTETQQIPQENRRSDELRAHFFQWMQSGIVTPLFNYQYQVSAPPRISGVQLTAWGWFDFCQAWVPPPLPTESA